MSCCCVQLGIYGVIIRLSHTASIFNYAVSIMQWQPIISPRLFHNDGSYVNISYCTLTLPNEDWQRMMNISPVCNIEIYAKNTLNLVLMQCHHWNHTVGYWCPLDTSMKWIRLDKSICLCHYCCSKHNDTIPYGTIHMLNCGYFTQHKTSLFTWDIWKSFTWIMNP